MTNALVVKLVDTKDLKGEGFTKTLVSDSLTQSQRFNLDLIKD